MSGSMCRLSVQAGAGGAIDLVLPATPPVAELLPTIVELTGAPSDPGGWRLSRLNGRRVDESISLYQNMIDDGDLLILTSSSVPLLPARPREAAELTATTAASPEASSAIPRLVFLWAVVITALIICWHGGTVSGSLAATAGCVAAAVTAALIGRSDRPSALTLGCAAIVFGAAAGFLAVPSQPSAPNALLAAAAAMSASVVLLRICPSALPLAAGTVGCCLPIALTAALATARQLPPGAIGAMLSTVALTVLSAAPRLALWAAGLTSDPPAPKRAARAHRVLTALVLGSAATVALGAGYVAVGHQRGAALVFGWLLTSATLLRVSSFVDAQRRWALTVSGLCCATTAFATTCLEYPDWTPWLSVAVLVIGIATLRRGAPGAAALRMLAGAEVVTLALLVPSALWVADVYAMVRGK